MTDIEVEVRCRWALERSRLRRKARDEERADRVSFALAVFVVVVFGLVARAL